MFPFRPDPNSKQYFKRRLRSLLRFDELRLQEILESIQYCLGYLILGFTLGSFLDSVFPDFDKDVSTSSLIFEILLQAILIVIAVFYSRKIVKLMPSLFSHTSSKFRPYETSEYSGEITISMILIGSQINFIRKIDLLSHRFETFFIGEEHSLRRITPLIA